MLTEAQKNVLLTTIDGLAENAAEMAREDGVDLSEEDARIQGAETLVSVLNEDGFVEAVASGYIMAEDDDCEPVDFTGVSVEEMVTFITAAAKPEP